MKRFDLSDVSILLGLVLVTTGLWRIYPPAALIGLGTLLLVAGARAAR